jgi:SET domain-containing protein
MTGEKRMCIQTLKPVKAGDEILVDYGANYFENGRRASRTSQPPDEGDGAPDHARTIGGKRKAKSAQPRKRARVEDQLITST